LLVNRWTLREIFFSVKSSGFQPSSYESDKLIKNASDDLKTKPSTDSETPDDEPDDKLGSKSQLLTPGS
jgi:hypothetical protein